MPIRDKLVGKKVNGLNSKGNLNIIIFLEIYAKEFGQNDNNGKDS